MAKIIWTDNALSDLDDIAQFIAERSQKHAKITVQNLFSAPNILENNPRIGREIEDFVGEDIRKLIVGKYRIVYQLCNETINILTVHHGSRLIENALRFGKKKN